MTLVAGAAEQEPSPGVRSAAPFALAVSAAYLTVQFLVFRAMPVYGWSGSIACDSVLSLPRLACIAVLVAFAVRHGGPRRWGWTWDATGEGVAALVFASTITAAGLVGYGMASALPTELLGLAWLDVGSTVIFEEAAFRSLLFCGLRERLPPLAAAILSSAAFAVYHFEVRPSSAWPQLFVYGLGTCAAVHRRTGLFWVIAAHWLVDGLWLHANEPPGLPWAASAHGILKLAGPVVFIALLLKDERPALAAPAISPGPREPNVL